MNESDYLQDFPGSNNSYYEYNNSNVGNFGNGTFSHVNAGSGVGVGDGDAGAGAGLGLGLGVGGGGEFFYDGDDEIFEYPLGFRIVCYILYNLVFLCGLCGNLLVFYTIHYTHPRMKSVQNYFLGNLALGDLVIVILCVPTGYITLLWQYWPFGTIACHLLTPAKAVGVFVSSYTLVALAIDRYLAILYPLEPGLTRRQSKIIVIIIWMAALITAIPVAIYAQIEIHEASGLQRCGEYGWKSYTEELIYSLVLLCLQYIFPVCVLIFTYVRISLVVWGRRLRHTHSGHALSAPQTPSKGKRKTVILSLSVVAGYTLAWLPYNSVYMIYKNGPDWILDAEFFPYAFLICHFLAMSHTTFNPFIYGLINSKFRRSFSLVFFTKCPCIAKLFGVDPDRLNFNMAPSWRTSSYQRSFLGSGRSIQPQNGSYSETSRLSKLVTSQNARNSGLLMKT